MKEVATVKAAAHGSETVHNGAWFEPTSIEVTAWRAIPDGKAASVYLTDGGSHGVPVSLSRPDAEFLRDALARVLADTDGFGFG